MKSTTRPASGLGRTLLAATLLVALVAFASPALAYTPAEGAKILNVVAVQYQGTDGTVYDANASSLVTVTLAPAALTVSGPPAAGVPGDTGATVCPPTVNSGGTAVAVNALSANANGDDDYTLSLSGILAADADNESVTYRVLDFDGTELIAATSSPADLQDFGSSLVVGVSGTDTLLFDGGVDLVAMFSPGDVVVVKDTANGHVEFEVVAANNGTAVSHDNEGDIAHSDEGATNDANAYGTLQLTAFETTLGGVTYGSNTTPAFDTTPPAEGTVVGRMVLVEVSVSADATSQDADGTVDFAFDTADSGGSNTTTDPCQVTFNQAAQLTIMKQVENLTVGGPLGATASGAPGDTLQYTVTVENPDSSDANLVVVADAVPVYTTLVTSGVNFATASINGGAAFDLTTASDDTEDGTIASGGAAGTAAGDALTFYLGDGNNGDSDNGNETGGTLAGGDVIVITYQVKID